MNVKVIILAAGLGKRFGSPMPKVLASVGGKPMVVWVVEAVLKSGVTDRPVVVVGAGADTVRAALGDACDYVTQDQLSGTGHAVACARAAVEHRADTVLVLYGDMPLVTPTTIRRLVDTHAKGSAVLTMATVTVPDFADWRQSFASFGRIIRDGAGQLQRIVEVRDATAPERQITEVNPSLFCFQASWLWPALTQLTNRNAQGEYYLTDLLALAMSQGQRVESLPVEPREAMGVNDAEELKVVSEIRAIHPVDGPAVHVSSGAIVTRGGGDLEVLLMHRRVSHSWHLPKGTQAPGETLEDTAVREVHEETGLQIRLGPYLGSLESVIRRNGQSVPKRTHYFLASPVGGDIRQHDAEHDEVMFLPYAEALQRLEEFSLHEREGEILRAVDPRAVRG